MSQQVNHLQVYGKNFQMARNILSLCCAHGDICPNYVKEVRSFFSQFGFKSGFLQYDVLDTIGQNLKQDYAMKHYHVHIGLRLD